MERTEPACESLVLHSHRQIIAQIVISPPPRPRPSAFSSRFLPTFIHGNLRYLIFIIIYFKYFIFIIILYYNYLFQIFYIYNYLILQLFI